MCFVFYFFGLFVSVGGSCWWCPSALSRTRAQNSISFSFMRMIVCEASPLLRRLRLIIIIKKKKKRRKEQMKCVFGPDSARRVGNAHFCAPPLSHSDSLHSLPLDFLSFFLFRFAHFGFTSRAHTIASEWTKKPTKRIEPKSTHLRWMREWVRMNAAMLWPHAYRQTVYARCGSNEWNRMIHLHTMSLFSFAGRPPCTST